MSDDDLTARVAELAAIIEAGVAEDESAAKALATATRFVDGRPDFYGCGGPAAEAYWDRMTPERALRRAEATRALVAEILAEGHYSDESGYYSCSQARDWVFEEAPAPGSGCSDRERAGKPCDCGRDAGVARKLGIIASEWGTA